jgi:hypothetical protein
LDGFILPEVGKPDKLKKFNKHCTARPSSSLYLDSAKNSSKNFGNLTPGVHRKSGKTVPYGFNGLILKILVEYDINNIRFRHLLIGGMYYQYGIETSIPVPNNEIPVRNVWSGFFKPDISLWKWKEKKSKSFSDLILRQRVRDIAEDGVFRSSIGPQLQPGFESPIESTQFTGPTLILRMARPAQPGEEIVMKHRPSDSVPNYWGVENKVRAPQPRFKPLQ